MHFSACVIFLPFPPFCMLELLLVGESVIRRAFKANVTHQVIEKDKNREGNINNIFIRNNCFVFQRTKQFQQLNQLCVVLDRELWEHGFCSTA